MGTYNISGEELLEKFKEFLQSFEGDISAEVIAEVWNKLAKKYGWNDILKVETKAKW